MASNEEPKAAEEETVTPPPPPSTTEQAAPPAFSFNFGDKPKAAPVDGAAAGLNALTLVDETTGYVAPSAASVVAGEEDEEEDEEEGEEVHPQVFKRIMGLKSLEEEREAIFKEYCAERAALENKYAEKYAEGYESRKQVVNGEVDVTATDANGNVVENPAATIAPAVLGGDGPAPTGVPNFWLQAIARCEPLAELVEQDDLQALSFCTDVRVIDDKDYTGFKIEFDFKTNPYFTNTILTKTYKVPNMFEPGEPVLDSVEGTEIAWKPKQNLCFDEKKKKQRAKKSGKERVVVTKTKKESFFHFFIAPDMDAFKTQMESGELEEEEMEELMAAFDQDYECANIIRHSLVPKAVLWYTGEMDEGEEEGEFEEGEYEDESDEEESDEDEEEDGDYKPRRGGKGRGGKKGMAKSPGGPLPTAGGDGTQQECKQS